MVTLWHAIRAYIFWVELQKRQGIKKITIGYHALHQKEKGIRVEGTYFKISVSFEKYYASYQILRLLAQLGRKLDLFVSGTC